MGIRDLVRASVEMLNGLSDGGLDNAPPQGAHAPELADERRDELRVDRFGWARYQAGEIEGQGLVTNLSLTGAMVERCTEPLGPGDKVCLRLKPAGGFRSVPIDAEVVRATEDGFAVQFVELEEPADETLREVIEAALA